MKRKRLHNLCAPEELQQRPRGQLFRPVVILFSKKTDIQLNGGRRNWRYSARRVTQRAEEIRDLTLIASRFGYLRITVLQ